MPDSKKESAGDQPYVISRQVMISIQHPECERSILLHPECSHLHAQIIMQNHHSHEEKPSPRSNLLTSMLVLLLLAAGWPVSAGLLPPPLIDGRRISFKEVASRACASVEAAFADGYRRVSVEIPQISDVTSAARKFEDDNSFLLLLVEMMGGGQVPTAVGCDVAIADNWRASGEYLTEEGLYGYRFPGLNLRQPQAGTVTVLGNSEIGCSALRELPSLDDGRGNVLLFNLPLDRLSFFDKIGMPDLDDVVPAYLLRRVGTNALLSREYPAEYSAWGLQNDGSQPLLLTSQPEPFKPRAIEATLRGGS